MTFFVRDPTKEPSKVWGGGNALVSGKAHEFIPHWTDDYTLEQAEAFSWELINKDTLSSPDSLARNLDFQSGAFKSPLNMVAGPLLDCSSPKSSTVRDASLHSSPTWPPPWAVSCLSRNDPLWKSIYYLMPFSFVKPFFPHELLSQDFNLHGMLCKENCTGKLWWESWLPRPCCLKSHNLCGSFILRLCSSLMGLQLIKFG